MGEGYVGPSFDDVLAAASRGEVAAIRVLYRRLAQPVAAYLRNRGCRDVDDVASDVLISIFTGLDRFRGTEEEFRAWSFTIARRRWIDEQRRASRRLPVTAYDPASDPRHTASAEDVALSNGGATVAMLGRLSAEQREVLELRLLADLSIEQVARVMGKRPDAVKALQRRAMAALRRMIGETAREVGG